MPRIRPATYELRIPQRATLEEEFILEAGGEPVDLTGYSIYASIYRDERRQEKIVDLDVSYVNRSQGRFKLSLSRSITATINRSGHWDCLVVEPSGTADYWLEGLASLDVGLTAAP